jgi:hypothetical protein
MINISIDENKVLVVVIRIREYTHMPSLLNPGSLMFNLYSPGVVSTSIHESAGGGICERKGA